jgi:hypothetical protein
MRDVQEQTQHEEKTDRVWCDARLSASLPFDHSLAAAKSFHKVNITKGDAENNSYTVPCTMVTI